MKTKMMLATAGIGLLLTGCSGGPSTGDVEQALQAATDQMAQEMAQMGMPAEDVSFDVHSRNCAEVDGGRAYDCTIEATLSDGRGNTEEIVDEIRMVEGNNGWRVTR